MKRIGFISNLFPSKKDPTFGSFVGLSYQQLQAMGYQLSEPIVIDARVSALKKLLAYVKFVSSGVSALLSNKYDFFYIHYLTYSTLCLLPVLPFKKIKYLVNIHGDDLVGTRFIHKVMGLPSSYILKHAEAVVVPSLYFKRQLLARHNFIKESHIIISESAGFREDIFYAKDATQLTKAKTGLHFGYISRVDEGKGWELMLTAFSLLQKNNPKEYSQATLSVYGAGAQTAAFIDMVSKLNLGDVVSYYGPLSQKELGAKYRSFDYFLFPTRRESFGLVAVEALGCGTPVICSEIEPLTDMVFHNNNGFLFTDGCAEHLYRSISHCFSLAPEDYLVLSQSAINSAEQYKSTHVAKRLHDAIEAIF
ncbi:glycosyltransferase family 4 protein [Colwellia sp. D2M02]|uniref:glycosyltransferase family 4 protein n=1 Tax=Colwellia sp. D2M02 TaxID=2841562 RepID=UPI001C085B87|nr:glycosyltransferase family 4 protein [Colwellia sp. D2M02]MBU2891915.1 glycosyltransferase family 4 protein [Colwellia sp. D2M02]